MQSVNGIAVQLMSCSHTWNCQGISQDLSQNVVLELKSKEAYLRGGGYMVLRVNLGPGECWFPLNDRVLGTRGSREPLINFLKYC